MFATYLLLALVTFVSGMLTESLLGGGDRIPWEDWVWPALLWPVFVLVVLWCLAQASGDHR